MECHLWTKNAGEIRSILHKTTELSVCDVYFDACALPTIRRRKGRKIFVKNLLRLQGRVRLRVICLVEVTVEHGHRLREHRTECTTVPLLHKGKRIVINTPSDVPHLGIFRVSKRLFVKSIFGSTFN